jgi:hypothetical protein
LTRLNHEATGRSLEVKHTDRALHANVAVSTWHCCQGIARDWAFRADVPPHPEQFGPRPRRRWSGNRSTVPSSRRSTKVSSSSVAPSTPASAWKTRRKAWPPSSKSARRTSGTADPGDCEIVRNCRLTAEMGSSTALGHRFWPCPVVKTFHSPRACPVGREATSRKRGSGLVQQPVQSAVRVATAIWLIR